MHSNKKEKQTVVLINIYSNTVPKEVFLTKMDILPLVEIR